MTAAARLLCTSLVLIAHVAAAAPAKGRSKAAASPSPKVGLIVLFGAGKTPADADAVVASFKGSGAKSSVAPTRLLSSDVKGLKPGFHAAVLGACPREQVDPVLAKVRAVVKDAYVRWVAKEGPVAAMKCPSIELPAATPASAAVPTSDDTSGESCFDCPQVKTEALEVAKGQLRLTVKLTTTTESNGEFESSEWSAAAELHRGSTVVDSKTAEAPDFAKVEKFAVDGDRVILDTYDLSSDCKGGEFYDGAKVHRLFRIVKGAIALEEKRTDDWGMCTPSNEGVSDCEHRCHMQRYNAMESVCRGPANREKCEEALAEYDQNAEPCGCE
jgi:hypothetical protein